MDNDCHHHHHGNIDILLEKDSIRIEAISGEEYL